MKKSSAPAHGLKLIIQ
uniref:Uncharacterized protein n=1 Tax=Arundo donax TaxID=35708 RepID=A0A0A9BXM7_ARUDO